MKSKKPSPEFSRIATKALSLALLSVMLCGFSFSYSRPALFPATVKLMRERAMNAKVSGPHSGKISKDSALEQTAKRLALSYRNMRAIVSSA